MGWPGLVPCPGSHHPPTPRPPSFHCLHPRERLPLVLRDGEGQTPALLRDSRALGLSNTPTGREHPVEELRLLRWQYMGSINFTVFLTLFWGIVHRSL